MMGERAWQVFVGQFKNLLVVILLGAVALACAVGSPISSGLVCHLR